MKFKADHRNKLVVLCIYVYYTYIYKHSIFTHIHICSLVIVPFYFYIDCFLYKRLIDI